MLIFCVTFSTLRCYIVEREKKVGGKSGYERFFVYRAVSKKANFVFSRVAAAVTAELIMVAGYGIFEAFMYGSVATALLGVGGNLIQGLMGIVSSVVIYEAVIKRIPKVV